MTSTPRSTPTPGLARPRQRPDRSTPHAEPRATPRTDLGRARALGVDGRHLLARLIESPDLAREVRALSPVSFASLVRELGVEDAGALVALATTPQLVAAFDEHLFENDRPGERETLEPRRLAAWLEVMLEGGAPAAAARLAELSPDFVLAALTTLVSVLDHDALRERLSYDAGDDDDAAAAVDKALESCLSHERDGYLVVSRDGLGWDAVLELLLALDAAHRPLLERLLDRAARLSAPLLGDLDELHHALTLGDALADDVEGEREARRSAQGFVEPRSARAFLTLARDPAPPSARDPLTSAYFRELEPAAALRGAGPSRDAAPTRGARGSRGALPASAPSSGAARLDGLVRAGATTRAPSLEAWRALADESPEIFAARLEELAYLTNVLAAAATTPSGERMTAVEAAEAALATVTHGAALVASKGALLGAIAHTEALRAQPADLLFRRASGALAREGRDALVRSLADLEAPPPRTGPRRKRARGRLATAR